MTIQTLYTAATGMKAMETKLDVIANNMANVNTTAFKKDRANFEDLLYRQYRFPGAQDADGDRTSTGVAVGLGVRTGSTQTDYGQGAFQTTHNQYDMAIEGEGFFKVKDPAGDFLYTRSGNFGLNATNQLVLGSAYNGYPLEPAVTIPEGSSNVTITGDGQVQYTASDGSQVNGPQLQLAKFINPQGLLKLGDNLYKQTEASGTASDGNPALNGYGSIRQGFLEASNVEPVNELIDLITTQRSFELNSQVVQAGDQIMQTVANLRRA